MRTLAKLKPNRDIDALAKGNHPDPFAVLGQHTENGQTRVRTVMPNVDQVELIRADTSDIIPLQRVHDEGVFEVDIEHPAPNYQFRVTRGDNTVVVEDPYRFPSQLGEIDEHLIAEGRHNQLYHHLGAHAVTVDGCKGINFAVWAPNASRVSVISDCNYWDGRCHPMRFHPAIGIWELFIPAAKPGDCYKYELLDHNGHLLPLKADPIAFHSQVPPQTASIIYSSHYQWQDHAWQERRMQKGFDFDSAMTIYELHAASWRHDEHGPLSIRELATQLLPYIKEMGFTHIELMPVTAHPYGGSWGYQPIGLFAPDSRLGEPDDFRYLIDQCHINGIGVIMDWVPAHFPLDEHGLSQFDGTHLYEHADPKRRDHPDWGTYEFNMGRREVVNYLTASALYWVNEFHIDALRVDAVASMLYLDYSRESGQWVPNQFGGNADLEAVDFLKHFNACVHAAGAITIAEESTAWPQVTGMVEHGGLGFSLKWNMGWMNDSLHYMREDPIHRSYHHDKITFGLHYAFSENFVLPLSHDEVVHGKRALLNQMPGDDWQRFANLRAYYCFMYCHPGKKLLFMGNEIAQQDEWNHNQSLDWHLLEYESHRGIQSLVKDLNHLLRQTPALYENDFSEQGFAWIEYADSASSVFAFLRWNREKTQPLLFVVNFTPVPRERYRLGVPLPGNWQERLNSDSDYYGGSDTGNTDTLTTQSVTQHGFSQSIELTLPPLGALLLTHKS